MLQSTFEKKRKVCNFMSILITLKLETNNHLTAQNDAFEQEQWTCWRDTAARWLAAATAWEARLAEVPSRQCALIRLPAKRRRRQRVKEMKQKKINRGGNPKASNRFTRRIAKERWSSYVCLLLASSLLYCGGSRIMCIVFFLIPLKRG